MTAQDKAYEDYNAGMKYREIADKYGVSLSTVKSWSARYWRKSRGAPEPKKVAKGCKKIATDSEKVATKKRGGGQPGNHNALTHGLFAKYLPEETLEIVTEVEASSPLDILWANIKIKFAAILRAQKIMLVSDNEDHTVIEEKVALAVDKEAKFLVAQARAMSVLLKMIQEYEALAKSDLATEEQKARIGKLKAEVQQLNASGQTEGKPDVEGYITALRGEVTEIWNDEAE